MRWVALALALWLCGAGTALPASRERTGNWNLQARGDGSLDFELRYHGERPDETWEHQFSISRSALGLSTSDLTSQGSHRRFEFSPDPGTFACDGWVSDGRGSGSFVFTPSVVFVTELKKRGVAAPSESQQFRLGFEDFSLATLDEFHADGYRLPDVDDLIAMIAHGVTPSYIHALHHAGYALGSVDALIHLVDHGVTAEYAARLPGLIGNRPSADDLAEAADHGVTLDFASGMNAAFGKIALARDIAMADHGVSANFVAGLRRLGYDPSPDDAIELVDHGVSLHYIERLRDHGYKGVSFGQLIRLRDAGI